MGPPGVIADSSVLILAARSGSLGLLKDLFGAIEIPPEVASECLGASLPGASALRSALDDGWLRIARIPQSSAGLARQHPNLGDGELAVIALAAAGNAPIVLVDDALARQVARLAGLRPVGSLGILALAHRRGLLKTRAAVEDAVRRLLQAGLWVAPEVIEAFWASIGGRADP